MILNQLYRRKNSRIPSLHGFTLVEFLIYMAILAIILTVLTGVFGAVLDSGAYSHSNASIQQDAQYILNKMTYDIQHASSILSPTLGVSSNSLQLALSSVATTYTVDGNGNFLISANGSSDMLTSYDASMSGLQFTRMGNVNGKNSIRMTFQLTSRVRSQKGYESQSYQTTISTR